MVFQRRSRFRQLSSYGFTPESRLGIALWPIPSIILYEQADGVGCDVRELRFVSGARAAAHEVLVFDPKEPKSAADMSLSVSNRCGNSQLHFRARAWFAP